MQFKTVFDWEFAQIPDPGQSNRILAFVGYVNDKFLPGSSPIVSYDLALDVFTTSTGNLYRVSMDSAEETKRKTQLIKILEKRKAIAK